MMRRLMTGFGCAAAAAVLGAAAVSTGRAAQPAGAVKIVVSASMSALS